MDPMTGAHFEFVEACKRLVHVSPDHFVRKPHPYSATTSDCHDDQQDDEIKEEIEGILNQQKIHTEENDTFNKWMNGDTVEQKKADD